MPRTREKIDHLADDPKLLDLYARWAEAKAERERWLTRMARAFSQAQKCRKRAAAAQRKIDQYWVKFAAETPDTAIVTIVNP